MTIFTVAITAPVFPALTTPETVPSRISRAATRIDESFFRRAAVAADSSIVMNFAGMDDFDRSIVDIVLRQQRCRRSSWPTRTMATPNCSAAWIAPSTSTSGA